MSTPQNQPVLPKTDNTQRKPITSLKEPQVTKEPLAETKKTPNTDKAEDTDELEETASSRIS